MNDGEPILGLISAGIELRQLGRNAEARALFDQLWRRVEAGAGSPLDRCVLAHSIADAQDDATEELRWDTTALEAAGAVTDDDVVAAGVGMTAAALYPSLHVNLAECYLKLGDIDRARVHLDDARHTLDALPDSEYGALIRGGVDDLERRLGQDP